MSDCMASYFQMLYVKKGAVNPLKVIFSWFSKLNTSSIFLKICSNIVFIPS
jgi:hypothetical protein